MSVRTFDPRPPEIFKPALCTAGCGFEYHSICRLCNLAYCFNHLKNLPHACDTKREYLVLEPEEVAELFGEPGTDPVDDPDADPVVVMDDPEGDAPPGCLGCNYEPIRTYLVGQGYDLETFTQVPKSRYDLSDVICDDCGRGWRIDRNGPKNAPAGATGANSDPPAAHCNLGGPCQNLTSRHCGCLCADCERARKGGS